MANIPRLRAVLKHDATQSVWIQPLAVVYWLYTTNPQGALRLLKASHQSNLSSKNTYFVIPVVYGLIYHGCQPISIQG
jgi:hypothetical protein